MVMVVDDAGDMSPSSEVSVKENVLEFAARVLGYKNCRSKIKVGDAVPCRLDIRSYFFKSYFKIVLPATPTSSKWFCPLGFPTKLVMTLRAICSAHPIHLNLITQTQFYDEYKT